MSKLIAIYSAILAASIIGFWFFLDTLNFNGYIVLVFLIVNPVIIISISFISSVLINEKKIFLFMVVLGFLYMLLGYFTFDLLNMIVYGRLLFPSITMWVIGFILALVGFSLSKIIAYLKENFLKKY